MAARLVQHSDHINIREPQHGVSLTGEPPHYCCHGGQGRRGPCHQPGGSPRSTSYGSGSGQDGGMILCEWLLLCAFACISLDVYVCVNAMCSV
eukprot:GHVU01016256.1.p2 GENE.GHVU01016256.1~~GHVU01016256.1.p2  ORF type:complete len:101 (-),score=4.30 GHVU01016256.1:365-643(-)